MKIAVMYRHVQLLANLCNEIQQRMMMVPLLVAATLVNAFTIATLANIQFTAENLIITCILVAGFVDTIFVILFALGGMVIVNRKSTVFIEKLKYYDRWSPVDIRRLWIPKFAKGCQPLKIKFGVNNFIEKLTPLKCLHCSARLTIQILLSERRHGR